MRWVRSSAWVSTPPAVEVEHHQRRHEVQPHSARTQGGHQHAVARIGGELPDGVVAGGGGHAAGQQQRTERLEDLGNGLGAERGGDELAEHQRLLARRRHGVQPAAQAEELGRGAGARTGVADLLQPQDQLQHMRHPQLRAQRALNRARFPGGVLV